QHPSGGGARRCSGDDQVPVTSPSFTPTGIADAADITAIDDATNTQYPIELCIFSAQFEWLMDAAKPGYCKRRDVGHPRSENQPGHHRRRNRSWSDTQPAVPLVEVARRH